MPKELIEYPADLASRQMHSRDYRLGGFPQAGSKQVTKAWYMEFRSERIRLGRMRKQANQASSLLKLLANPNRLLIVSFLIEGERSVAEIETWLDIRQPTLSQQLGELREAGILSSRRAARSVFYRLQKGWAKPLIHCYLFGNLESLDRAKYRNERGSTWPRGQRMTPPSHRVQAAVFAEVSSVPGAKSIDINPPRTSGIPKSAAP